MYFKVSNGWFVNKSKNGFADMDQFIKYSHLSKAQILWFKLFK